jgi:hypothetical protein
VIFVGGITMLSTATGAALAVAGFHRAALALGTPPGAALWLSLLLGGATVLWPYGTSFYSEGWQAATIIWAAAFVLEGRITIAAVWLTITGLIKATSVIFLPAFVVWAWADSSKSREQRTNTAAILAAGIGAAVLIHLGWNNYRFGSLFDFGYDWTETIPALPARAFLIADIPRGLLVLLATPGKSLFLWAPILVLSVLGAADWWRRDRAFTLGVGAAVASGLVVFAAYLWPDGGYSHGPRHLVPIVPLFALLAAGPHASRWSRTALTACTVIGFAIAATSVAVSFLEDQALRRGADGRPIPGYYDVIEPPQGRPNNRYRIDYIPFVTALRNPDWASEKAPLGMGPDLFLVHVQQARRQLPDGPTIPANFSWWWAVAWGTVAAAGAAMIWRAAPEARPATSGGDTNPSPAPEPTPPGA